MSKALVEELPILVVQVIFSEQAGENYTDVCIYSGRLEDGDPTYYMMRA